MPGSSRRATRSRIEFVLVYQPKLDLRTGHIIGVEALLRWHSQELGFVSPGTFIPLAEETGLIVSIGEWALRTTCMQGVAWASARPAGPETMVTLAHSLKLKFVAEGVETWERQRALLGIDCDQTQGYFFSQPASQRAGRGERSRRHPA